METAYVRLKPYDPKIGNVRQRFRMGAAAGWGDLEFVEGQVMELDRTSAQWLYDNVLQVDYNPGTPKAFDIWYSKEELAKTLRAERLKRMGHPATVRRSLKVDRPPKLQHAEISHADTPAEVSAYEAELAAEEQAESATGDLGPGDATPRPFAEDEEVGGAAVDYADKDVTADAGAFSDMEPSDDDLINAAMDAGEEVSEDPPPPPPRPAARKRAPKKKSSRKKPAAKPPKPTG